MAIVKSQDKYEQRIEPQQQNKSTSYNDIQLSEKTPSLLISLNSNDLVAFHLVFRWILVNPNV